MDTTLHLALNLIEDISLTHNLNLINDTALNLTLNQNLINDVIPTLTGNFNLLRFHLHCKKSVAQNPTIGDDMVT